ncbi:hypothetical protein Tco_1273895 [Tanacetum coccineum]
MYESFTCWRIVTAEGMGESGGSSMAGGSRSFETPEFKRLLRHPSVPTPSKIDEGKKHKRVEAEESDVEASFLTDNIREYQKHVYSNSSKDINKYTNLTIQTSYELLINQILSQAMNTGTSAIPDQGRTNLYQQAIASTSNYPFFDAHRRKTGAATKCKSRNATKGVAFTSRGAEVSYHNIGAPSYQCVHCNASMWYEERINKGNRAVNPSFSLCCQEGKLRLPKFNPTPQPLHNLLNYNDLATTRVNGQSYHRIGSLIPKEGTQPRYAQLWFFDTANEVRNRMGAFIDKDNSDAVDATTVQSLIQMLDQYSLVAKAFRMARDWCHSHASVNVELHFLFERTNARQYNKPTVAEVAALIINDFGDGILSRDIIVNKLHSGPKIISELHPAYMALQYPLLFSYGDDGFCGKIPYYTNRVVYVIEFKKRGLPHAHILLWLEDNSKCKTAAQIDDIISAELPSPTDDPDGYKAVTDYMLHGPCGKDGRYAPCITEGKCSKHYPKQFYTKIVLDEDGYPIYRHRDNKASFKKGKLTFDNRHVVPHNRYLLLKYHAHINVEWCNRSKAIKYLFKYLNKGPDRATVVIQENGRKGDHVTAKKVVAVNEINNYLNYRYLAPCEAVWRLFSFDIHYSYPYVIKLNFHLPNQNLVTWQDSEFLPALLEREGPKNFDELMSVNNRLCHTFKEACFAYGLLNDDREWTKAISEASLWALGPQLRDLFVTILLFCDVSRPLKLWEET